MAADLVDRGMTVGLGTGPPSHSGCRLSRADRSKLDASPPRHASSTPRANSVWVEDFTSIERFHIAIGGADQISANGWLVKTRCQRKENEPMTHGYTKAQHLLAFDHSPFIRAQPHRCVAGRSEAVDLIAADYL